MLSTEPSNTVTQFTISSEENSRQSSLIIYVTDNRNFKFHDVNVVAAQRIAEAAAKNNVSRLIHVSSYNADPKSESKFYASKGQGEIAVREAFPEATIVRPPPMFGTEDRFLNPLAAPRFYFASAPLEKPTFNPAYVISLEIGIDSRSTMLLLRWN